MATTRWIDKTQISPLLGTEAMPITNAASEVDFKTTPDQICGYDYLQVDLDGTEYEIPTPIPSVLLVNSTSAPTNLRLPNMTTTAAIRPGQTIRLYNFGTDTITVLFNGSGTAAILRPNRVWCAQLESAENINGGWVGLVNECPSPTSFQITGANFNIGTDTGTGAAYEVAIPANPTFDVDDAFVSGEHQCFIMFNPTNASELAATLSLNGGTAYRIVTGDDIDVAPNEMQPGIPAMLLAVDYGGMAGIRWCLLNPVIQEYYALISSVQTNNYNAGNNLSGVADAYTVDIFPTPPSYAPGMMVSFWLTAGAQNSTVTNPTLNVNSLGNLTIFDKRGAALSAGDINIGWLNVVYYDPFVNAGNPGWILIS